MGRSFSDFDSILSSCSIGSNKNCKKNLENNNRKKEKEQQDRTDRRINDDVANISKTIHLCFNFVVQ